jgi:hypothetical protein
MTKTTTTATSTKRSRVITNRIGGQHHPVTGLEAFYSISGTTAGGISTLTPYRVKIAKTNNPSSTTNISTTNSCQVPRATSHHGNSIEGLYNPNMDKTFYFNRILQ